MSEISAYAFDLKQVCGGYAYYSTFTYGDAPDDNGLEIRTPSTISLQRFSQALKELGLNFQRIRNQEELYNWTCIQGWGLADTDFARTHMPQWLKKQKCLTSPFGSFTDIGISSPSVRKRTFRGKFKERILKRDNYECINCSSKEELTLQHVIPYSRGGETSYRNLVTLCRTCNQNMGNETYRELFRMAGLVGDYEPSIIKNSSLDGYARSRALQLSRNIMHTRCDIY